MLKCLIRNVIRTPALSSVLLLDAVLFGFSLRFRFARGIVYNILKDVLTMNETMCNMQRLVVKWLVNERKQPRVFPLKFV